MIILKNNILNNLYITIGKFSELNNIDDNSIVIRLKSNDDLFVKEINLTPNLSLEKLRYSLFEIELVDMINEDLSIGKVHLRKGDFDYEIIVLEDVTLLPIIVERGLLMVLDDNQTTTTNSFNNDPYA